MPFRHIAEVEKLAVIEKYAAGLTMKNIQKETGIRWPTVMSILRKRSIPIREYVPVRKFELNEKAFDVLTEGAAYWLGFLMADGCLKVNTGNGLSWKLVLTLQESDAGHVEAFRGFIQSARPVEFIENNGHAAASFAVHSKRIGDALMNWGITPAKTHTGFAHPELAHNRHFWRGLVDGDGCIRMCEGGPTLDVAGNQRTMEQFVAFAGMGTVETGSGNSWRVRLRSFDAATAALRLYGACNFALERKAAAATACISYMMERRPWRGAALRAMV